MRTSSTVRAHKSRSAEKRRRVVPNSGYSKHFVDSNQNKLMSIEKFGRNRNAPSKATRLGFTLLELLVVIVIIGMLAAYVGPRYFSQIGKSAVTASRAQLEAFGHALDAYRLDTGHYPTTDQGLSALWAAPQGETRWNGPYLQKSVRADPWGHPYVYRAPGQAGADFDLLSYGKDGQPGGDGENADVSYR